MNVKVSIITVTYNSEKYLPETIDSVRNQTYNNIEYIIIDGASTDSTVEIIKNHEEDINYWISEEDDGIYHAMNKGIKIASGEIIGILNSDDCLVPDAIEKVIDISQSITKDKYVIHGNIARYNSNGIFVDKRGPKKIPFYYLLATPIKHPAMFVSKNVYDQLGEYDENCGLAADYDFILRVLMNDVDVRYIDEVLTKMKLVGVTSGDNQRATLGEQYKIIRKNTDSKIVSTVAIIIRFFYRQIRKILKY